MTFVLGIDPAYATLGLAVVSVQEGATPKLCTSMTLDLRSTDMVYSWAPTVGQMLTSLHGDFPFTCAVTETPPLLAQKASTTGKIWYVSGIIASWCAVHQMRTISVSPLTIKSVALDVLENNDQCTTAKPGSKKKDLSKTMVRRALTLIMGKDQVRRCRTSHEVDAALAALTPWMLDSRKPKRQRKIHIG